MNSVATAYLNNTLVVSVSEQKLDAWVSAPYRKNLLPSLNEKHLRTWLAVRNIVAGIKDDELKKIVERLRSSHEMLEKTQLAQGTPPTRGSDARLKYNFSTKLTAGQVEGDDQVNFHERCLINNVAAGSVLAEITPPTTGTPGLGVDGKPLTPVHGNDIPRPHSGRGVACSEDGLIFSAIYAGHATLVAEKTLEVHKEFNVEGDVDFKVGNLDFIGDLHISGNVLPGFVVKAEGDIVILGSIERNAEVETAGDLTVRGTIRSGRSSQRVRVGGTLRCQRIENSSVKVVGDVKPYGDLVSSRVECLGRLIGENTALRGCEIEAVCGIDIKQVGSKSGAPSILTVGITLELAREQRELSEACEKLALTVETITGAFQRRNEELLNDPAKLKNLPAVERGKFKMDKETMEQRVAGVEDRLAAAQERLEELAKIVVEKEGSVIAVSHDLYPQCTLNVRWEEWVIRTKMAKMIFYDDVKNNRIGNRTYHPNATVQPIQETLDDYALDSSFVENVEKEMTAKRLSSQALAKKLALMTAGDSQYSTDAMRIGLAAAQQKRYASPEVLVALSYAMFRTAQNIPTENQREELMLKVRKILRSVLAKDKLYAQAHSTHALIYEMEGRQDEAITLHKHASEITLKLTAKGDTAEIHRRYGAALHAKALRLSRNPATQNHAIRVFAQARTSYQTALSSGAQDACKLLCQIALEKITAACEAKG